VGYRYLYRREKVGSRIRELCVVENIFLNHKSNVPNLHSPAKVVYKILITNIFNFLFNREKDL